MTEEAAREIIGQIGTVLTLVCAALWVAWGVAMYRKRKR